MTRADSRHGLEATGLPPDTVGLLEGLTTTRAIRRYRNEPIPPEALRAILFAATRAPSGSNRQPFRFLVLTDGPNARAAKKLIGDGARRTWGAKREADRYEIGSGAAAESPKARLARTMQQFVDEFERVPVLILPCLVRYREPTPSEGASVYPACQNVLLAAGPRIRGQVGRASGLGHRPARHRIHLRRAAALGGHEPRRPVPDAVAALRDHSFLATSGPVMRASSGKVAAIMPSDTRIPPAVRR